MSNMQATTEPGLKLFFTGLYEAIPPSLIKQSTMLAAFIDMVAVNLAIGGLILAVQHSDTRGGDLLLRALILVMFIFRLSLSYRHNKSACALPLGSAALLSCMLYLYYDNDWAADHLTRRESPGASFLLSRAIPAYELLVSGAATTAAEDDDVHYVAKFIGSATPSAVLLGLDLITFGVYKLVRWLVKLLDNGPRLCLCPRELLVALGMLGTGCGLIWVFMLI